MMHQSGGYNTSKPRQVSQQVKTGDGVLSLDCAGRAVGIIQGVWVAQTPLGDWAHFWLAP